MLVEQQLFGLVDKVAIAIERLKTFEPPEGYYLCHSGGKDSVVIHALAKMSGVKFDAHHNLTTIDPPELVRFIHEHCKDVKIERPEKPFLVELVRMGFPIRQRRWCCEEYKENGGSGRVCITGIRAEESARRRRRKMVEVCYNDPTKRYVHIIFDWTERDVWEFIKSNNISYCSLYDNGWKRIGCLFCPMQGRERRLEETRLYPAYARAFIKAFEKLYALRKSQSNPSVDHWGSGEEMFWWWISGKSSRGDDAQCKMFD